MSNIAGKSYAMNVVTPIRWWMTPVNKLIFWLAGTRLFASKLLGLLTLSLIHYARWVILRPRDFPRLSQEQPEEHIQHSYMLFFSNFNGSWDQYVDSFSSSIPTGLDLLWFRNIGWPKSVPTQPFHRYITANQVWTNHYYNSYPMAASNDVKSAMRVKERLCGFAAETEGVGPDDFAAAYRTLTRELQHDLSSMRPTPIVSLAAAAVWERRVAENAEKAAYAEQGVHAGGAAGATEAGAVAGGA